VGVEEVEPRPWASRVVVLARLRASPCEVGLGSWVGGVGWHGKTKSGKGGCGVRQCVKLPASGGKGDGRGG